MISNAGGILGVWVYPSKTAPRYLLATKINISLLAVVALLAAVRICMLRYLNRQKIERRDELLRGVENLSPDEQVKGPGRPSSRFQIYLVTGFFPLSRKVRAGSYVTPYKKDCQKCISLT